MAKFGFSSLNNNLNSTDTTSNLGNQINELFSKTIAVRVKDIILDDTYPNFEELGGWNSIGTIFFEVVDIQNGNPPEKPIAKPLIPYLKNYPLVNEIVYLIKLPDSNLDLFTSSERYYYLNAVNIWNHPHHYGCCFKAFKDNRYNLPPGPKRNGNFLRLHKAQRIASSCRLHDCLYS